MNSEELKILIESAREAKGISQRELAKLTGISRSTLNDLINGKIKKVDIDDLRKIAETLDMSLQKLLKASGYDEMSLYFHAHKNKDKYADKYAVLLEGARRVGKSTIAEQFAINEYKSYILIDFSKTSDEEKACFDDINDLDMFFCAYRHCEGLIYMSTNP